MKFLRVFFIYLDLEDVGSGASQIHGDELPSHGSKGRTPGNQLWGGPPLDEPHENPNEISGERGRGRL
jgi:hypothetical protein